MLLNPLTFHNPDSVEELLDLYGSLENVRLQAGGTFLLNALKLMKRNGAKSPDHIINLQKISDLKGIRITKDSLTIKSMTTIDDIFNDKECTEALPVLKSVCKNISTQPIRNMATIGGNLTCRYTWTEMPAVAIGLNATLHFKTKEGAEESQDAETFFKNAAKTDALLTAVSFPIEKDVRIAYRRVRKSQGVDIPQLSILIKSTVAEGKLSQTRVAVNNCVDFAQRDSSLEDFLNGQDLTEKNMAENAVKNKTEKIYTHRASEYKQHMFDVSLKSAINELCS